MIFSFTKPNLHNASHNQFEKIQHNLKAEFSKGENIIREYANTRKELDRVQNEYDEYLERNANEEITDDSAANVARERRLKRRLWFTVVFEAILSLTAIKYFLAETLEFHLQWLPAVVLAIFIAFIILELAIEMRIDDNADEQENDLLNSVKKWSYIIPLVFIPGLNIFIIYSTPGNPLNILYAFFAVFSILLNFKTASYWKQYRILKHSEIAKKRISNYKNNIKNKEKVLYNLTFKKMPPINDKIITLSMKLRSIYETIKERERTNFILPVKYLFVMNNLIYHSDVFPIPQLSLTSPPDGDMRIALDSWSSSIFHQPSLPKRRLPEGNLRYDSSQEQDNTQESANTFGNANSYSRDNSFNNHDYENANADYTDNNSDSASHSDPETDQGIPDSEKYV